MLDWSKESLLRFHPDKCVCMRIGKSPPNMDVEAWPYSIEVKQLERSEEEKDLGVVIDTNLNFDKHISSNINKATSAAGLIRRSFEYLDAPMFKGTAHLKQHSYQIAIFSSGMKIFKIAFQHVVGNSCMVHIAPFSATNFNHMTLF